jgi:hypothetical protein
MFMSHASVESGSVRKVRRRYRPKFLYVTVPHRRTIIRIVNELRQAESLVRGVGGESKLKRN